MKKITSILLAALLVATLSSGVFAADETSEESSETAATETADTKEETEETSEEATESSEEAEETAETTANETTVVAEDAAPAGTVADTAVEAEEAQAPAFERDADKALILFHVGEKSYYSQIAYDAQIRTYPEVPKYITDDNGNKLVFNVWLDEEGVPFYPGQKVSKDLELTAHYAFANYTPGYVFVPTDKSNQQYAPQGPGTTLLANVADGAKRQASELSYKTGNYDLAKVEKQDDGAVKVFGAKVGTTYVSVKDSVTDTVAYIHVVTYQPAGQGTNIAPVDTVNAPEWSNTAATWGWNNNAIPKM